MEKKKKKSGVFSTILLIIVLLVGLSLLLYPTLANYWNSLHATKTISTYSQVVEEITDTEAEKMWQDALDYNERLSKNGVSFYLDDENRKEYESLLNIGGSGVMGYIEIEELEVLLPIYHGTSDGVLQIAVGHLDWSSLPVGGNSSHCVLSGHRGLPSAKLFTDIDELIPGDRFTIVILNNTLTYEVDQIRTVLPTEVQNLTVTPGMDYCTLVTCTPYGINTHRLLVRGHRIETEEAAKSIRVISDAVQVEPLLVAPIVAVPLLLVMFIVFIVVDGIRKRNGTSAEVEDDETE